MPLFDYQCLDCGSECEILITGSKAQLRCQTCQSTHLKKMIVPPSSLSGTSMSKFPGPGDTACCGSNATKADCAGPGSCCGKTPI